MSSDGLLLLSASADTTVPHSLREYQSAAIQCEDYKFSVAPHCMAVPKHYMWCNAAHLSPHYTDCARPEPPDTSRQLTSTLKRQLLVWSCILFVSSMRSGKIAISALVKTLVSACISL